MGRSCRPVSTRIRVVFGYVRVSVTRFRDSIYVGISSETRPDQGLREHDSEIRNIWGEVPKPVSTRIDIEFGYVRARNTIQRLDLRGYKFGNPNQSRVENTIQRFEINGEKFQSPYPRGFALNLDV